MDDSLCTLTSAAFSKRRPMAVHRRCTRNRRTGERNVVRFVPAFFLPCYEASGFSLPGTAFECRSIETTAGVCRLCELRQDLRRQRRLVHHRRSTMGSNSCNVSISFALCSFYKNMLTKRQALIDPIFVVNLGHLRWFKREQCTQPTRNQTNIGESGLLYSNNTKRKSWIFLTQTGPTTQPTRKQTNIGETAN